MALESSKPRVPIVARTRQLHTYLDTGWRAPRRRLDVSGNGRTALSGSLTYLPLAVRFFHVLKHLPSLPPALEPFLRPVPILPFPIPQSPISNPSSLTHFALFRYPYEALTNSHLNQSAACRSCLMGSYSV